MVDDTCDRGGNPLSQNEGLIFNALSPALHILRQLANLGLASRATCRLRSRTRLLFSRCLTFVANISS